MGLTLPFNAEPNCAKYRPTWSPMAIIVTKLVAWMDGWPAMETDAGRAVMKIPATKDKDLFKVVLPTPVATTLSISRAVDNHLATKYSK